MKSVLVLALLLTATAATQAATGFFDRFYVITNTGGGNVFNTVTTGTTPGTGAASGYNLSTDGVNPLFSNLGTYLNGSTLNLAGFEYKTFNDNGSNVTHANLYYRVYQGSPSGAFSNIVTNTPISNVGNNKTWQVTNGTTNLLNGLANGTYSLQVYTESFTNGVNTAGNIFGFQSAGNPVATFTVIPEPGRAALALLGFGSLFLRRRRA